MGAPLPDPTTVKNVVAAWEVYTGLNDGAWKGAGSRDVKASLGILCQHGLGPLLTAYFVDKLQRAFYDEYLSCFWSKFDSFVQRKERAQQIDDSSALHSWVVSTLAPALAELHSAQVQQKRRLADVLRSVAEAPGAARMAGASASGAPKPQLAFLESERAVAQFQGGTSAWLLTTAPAYLPELLRLYFAAQLEEFSGGVKRAARRSRRRESSVSIDSGGTSEDELGLDGGEDEADSGAGVGGSSSSALRRRRSRRSSSIMDEDDGVGGPGMAPHVEGGDAMEGVERSPECAPNRAGLVNKHLAGVLGDAGGGTSAWGVAGGEGGEGAGVGEMVRLMGVEWVAGVAGVARQLREVGLATEAETAYSEAICSHLQAKLLRAARGRYEAPVAAVFCRWIDAVPLRFLSLLLPPAIPPTPPSMYQSPAASPFPSPLACPATPGPPAPVGASSVSAALGRWKGRLEGLAYETLGELRTTELFDIIVDHPESLPALEDLRACLAHTERQPALVAAFRAQLRQRLLLPGAATTDILTHYIATIKSLRILDPSDVVLAAVSSPIQSYLRSRKDTIRGIVTLLTDDSAAAPGGDSLYEELSKTAAMAEADEREDDDARGGDSEEEVAAAQAWEPDPVAAAAERGSRRRRQDLISALVGMYGSKEALVNEYRVMLADRLLAKADYNTATDVRTLELLKLRFADANLHQCDVMLKDLADSKRINTLIHTQPARPSSPPTDGASPSATAGLAAGPARRQLPSQGRGIGRGMPQLPLPPRAAPAAAPSPPPADMAASRAGGSSSENEARLQAIRARMRALRSQGPPGAAPSEGEPTLDSVDATIVSALFWPPFQADAVRLPASVQAALDAYAARYQELKAPRKLAWKTGLGTVRLEVERGGRSVQYAVSPIHAAIVWQFQDRTRWPARELAEAVGAPLGVLRKKAVFWVNQGVLAESTAGDGGGVYRLVEGEEDGATGPTQGAVEEEGVTVVAEEEGESAVTSAEEQMAGETQIIKDFVLGMLTNLDAQPLDRIHNMLKMFIVDPPFDKSAHQLQAFLNTLVREEVIEFRDNLYRRVRRPDAA